MLQFSLLILILLFVNVFSFNSILNIARNHPRIFKSIRNEKVISFSLPNNLFQLEEEEAEVFYRISKNYLKSKLNYYTKVTKEILQDVLKQILPPVTIEELNVEVTSILDAVKLVDDQNKINDEKLIESIISNKFWVQAGPVVIQELIYLDCLYNYYQRKQNLLNDEDYEDLKSQLNWTGSDVATLSGKEALFITAVASSRRGINLLNDAEYEKLKKELQSQRSWVVRREADGLEKLGINTFLGYLHRAL